jgi:Molybdopterin oxidoreductase Fe4S4 domain/Molybdopterin oxidoreductase
MLMDDDRQSGGDGVRSLERFRACPLCEAGCGLAFEVKGGKAVAVQPDKEDVLSRGFVCPKGVEILNLESDPDRLTGPVRRSADGQFQPMTWEDAFDTIETRLKSVQRSHGKDAVSVYFGTVFAHKYGAMLVRNALKTALGTRKLDGGVVAGHQRSVRLSLPALRQHAINLGTGHRSNRHVVVHRRQPGGLERQTGCSRHATLACYAVELLNIAAGRLGEQGAQLRLLSGRRVGETIGGRARRQPLRDRISGPRSER